MEIKMLRQLLQQYEEQGLGEVEVIARDRYGDYRCVHSINLSLRDVADDKTINRITQNGIQFLQVNASE